MTIKNNIDKAITDAKDAAKKGIQDIKDATSEQLHRNAADQERERRKLESDDMTSSEKLESLAEEGKHRTQAEIDKAKRTVRDHT
jgi:hypothetical protein